MALIDLCTNLAFFGRLSTAPASFTQHARNPARNVEIGGRKVHLSLQPNPSHLEAVDPVVAGKVRARVTSVGLGIVAHTGQASCSAAMPGAARKRWPCARH